MHDSRLIGTWRSDARKTSAEIATRRDMRLGKNKKLVSLFGKLELRYTRSLCYSRFGKHESVGIYRVVAKDESSVAVVSFHPTRGSRFGTSILKENTTGFTLAPAAYENSLGASRPNARAPQGRPLTPGKSENRKGSL